MTDRPVEGSPPDGPERETAASRPSGSAEHPWRPARSISGVTVISGLGAVIGLLSNALVAYHFGAGRLTDAFFLAQSIPLVLAHLLQSGPLPSVFLPMFVRMRQEGSAGAAWDFLNNLLNFVLLLSAVLIVLGFVLAPWIVRTFGAGFDEPTRLISTHVLRFLIFTVVSHVLSGILVIALNALNLFILSAALSLIPSLGVAVCVGFFAPSMGLGAWIWGNLAGPAVFLFALVLALMNYGFRYRPVLELRQPELRETIRRVCQFFISSAFTQAQTLSTKFVASLLAPGSLSALTYAERIFLAASGLLIPPLPNVLFPELVRRQLGNRLKEFQELVFRASRFLVLLLTPVSIGMIVTSGWWVGLLLARGAFDAASADKTAWALALYFTSFIPIGYKLLFTNSFYALEKPRIVVLALCCAQGTIILGNFVLGYFLNYAGLALSFSLGQYALVAIQASYLRREFALRGVFWNPSNKRSLVAGLGMGITAVLVVVGLPNVMGSPLGVRIGGVLALVGVSALLYAVLIFGLNIPEARQAWEILRERLAGRAS